MSGGAYEYTYDRIRRLADDIECNEAAMTPERKWFVEHLRRVAKAAHDIEWVDSCDYSEGAEGEAIAACAEHAATFKEIKDEG